MSEDLPGYDLLSDQRRDLLDRDLVERADHQIRPGRRQLLGRVVPGERDRDTRRAASLSRLLTRHGVFEHHTSARGNAQLRGGVRTLRGSAFHVAAPPHHGSEVTACVRQPEQLVEVPGGA